MKRLLILSFASLALSALAACASDGDLSVRPDDPAIMYMGRTLRADSAPVRFTYPGVTAALNFNGTGLVMEAKPGSGYFMVAIDSIAPFKINFAETDSIVTLADSLDCGSHSARIVYAIEGNEKRPEIRGFRILGPDARLLPPPRRPDLKIEFIGNSITCGYGSEADSAQVHFAYENENHTLSYAYLTARRLDADFNIVARSGIGLYRSWGGPREGTPDNRMPDQYDNTLIHDHTYKWDHNSFHPDIIFMNLGTNDVSLENYDIDLYRQAAEDFVARLRSLHPDAIIVLATGSMLSGEPLRDIAGALDKVAKGKDRVYRFDFSPATGELGFGADWHPSRRQHQRMADELVPYLKTLIEK